MRNKPATVSLKLPPEFIELCKRDLVTPETVLRGFIADLCSLHNYAERPRDDGYQSNGSMESWLAFTYYQRVGYRQRAGAAKPRVPSPPQSDRPMMHVYRRAKGGDTWHFCRNCSKWPTKNYDERQYKRLPRSGQLCNECRSREANNHRQKR